MPASGPAAVLVLRGVGVTDGVRTAFVEDMSTRQITRHRQGDSLAGGRLGSVSIDQLTFESGSMLTTVRPGQNLFGQSVAVPTTPTSQPAGNPAGKPQPGGQPSAPPVAAEQIFAAPNQTGMTLFLGGSTSSDASP
ncbi:hypothetical protein [Humisphaera borealis]|uniref:Uncharacterized protein n=1 Tax=Humisphaera borealis TaxID=2807512 RepID=A0A7M2X276_9BACT|nr:hypothetical protein [Humisphaera borealis]QOV91161.1 hypothetical protein IPV69_07325 [Humisphaera borealis]